MKINKLNKKILLTKLLANLIQEFVIMVNLKILIRKIYQHDI